MTLQELEIWHRNMYDYYHNNQVNYERRASDFHEGSYFHRKNMNLARSMQKKANLHADALACLAQYVG